MANLTTASAAPPTMKVERYLPERHYETLCKWLHFYDAEPIEPDFLPPTGFVVEGLAMGFLYRSDTKMAQIETLVANVYAPVEERDMATDLVVTALIEEARAAGFRTLVGTTKLDAVVKRALKHGFTVDDGPYRLVTRVL